MQFSKTLVLDELPTATHEMTLFTKIAQVTAESRSFGHDLGLMLSVARRVK